MKKSNSIDLHGRYYDDVDLSLEKHFYDNEPPFKIITGISFSGYCHGP